MERPLELGRQRLILHVKGEDKKERTFALMISGTRIDMILIEVKGLVCSCFGFVAFKYRGRDGASHKAAKMLPRIDAFDLLVLVDPYYTSQSLQ